MDWYKLTDEQQLDQIKELSLSNPVMIFKHSTRCSISSTAYNRLERSWKEEQAGNIQPYYLDLLAYRNISNKIAEVFNVRHESPQILLIKNGECIYNASHLSISFEDLVKGLNH